MNLKAGKLRIFSLFFAILMVLQSWCFCPCTYAAYNRLMEVLNDSRNLTVEDIKPIVENNPYFAKETYSDEKVKERTVVYYALRKGENTDENRIEIAKYLIEHGASMGPMYKGGETPLHWFVRHGNIDDVKWLLSKGAEVNCKDKNGFTPLKWAACCNKVDFVKTLIDYNAAYKITDSNDNTTILHWAAFSGSVEVVKLLIDTYELDPNCKNFRKETPLYYAVLEGKTNCVKLLIETYEVDPNACTNINCGLTPLGVAVSKGHTECAKLLIEKGADVNKVSKGRYSTCTPLIMAVRASKFDCVKLLVEKGASVKAADDVLRESEKTTLIDCCENKEIKDFLQSELDKTAVDLDVCKVTGNPLGYEYDKKNNVLRIKSGGNYRIEGNGKITNTTIEISEGCEAVNLTLNGVKIDVTKCPNKAALVTKSNNPVNINIEGENSLLSGENCAGLQKDGKGKLTITGNDNKKDKLTAVGGYHAAGIGGGNRRHVEHIEISVCHIIAKGGAAKKVQRKDAKGNLMVDTKGNPLMSTWDSESTGGAGIGGGNYGNASDIVISNAIVKVIGEHWAAGIGAGREGESRNIIIRKSEVKATGGFRGAGIGSGRGGQYWGPIEISDSKVIATGMGKNATGIGHGDDGKTVDNAKLTISNSDITAEAGKGEMVNGKFVGGGSGVSGGIIRSGRSELNCIDHYF